MKILYITYESPRFPGGTGGQTRQYYLLKHLSDRHAFDYVGPRLSEENPEQYRNMFQKIMCPRKKTFLDRVVTFLIKKKKSAYPDFVQNYEGLRFQLSPLIKKALRENSYDLINVEHTNIAHWVHEVEAGIPKVLVVHNIKTVMWERYYKQASGFRKKRLYRDYERFKVYEKKYFRDYNGIVAVSDVDKELIRRLYGEETPLHVVPNGVDVDYFSPRDADAVPESIVFTGSMIHPPNEEAVLYFCREIFPRILAVKPNCRFSVVGSSPGKKVRSLANGRNIVVTGFVDDTRPYMASASVVVVPILSGSGTRLKIMESMSMSKAIVSTSVGAEGIEYTDGENIFIANDEASFASRVVELMDNRQKATEMGRNARRLVEGKYSWKILAERLDSVYKAVAGGS